MELEPGTKLGSFEIAGLLGEGGFGQVYRAKDTKLGRDVAIKVLPEAFAEDRERLARFEREAKLLAALDHPNIGALYDFQEADGFHFLVLQLIEGETLGDRVALGPMPIKNAIQIFVQIAQGLEAAHEAGIVHRDLKPANIMITPDDTVKILDFGIAKSTEGHRAPGAPTPTPDTPADPNAPTLPGTPTPPTSLTAEDMLVGTPSYMSPEQARGKPVDKRTDIWAFGCCLYETLTSTQPYTGETIADTINEILEHDPDWSRLPGNTPNELRTLLRRCLEKESKRRLSSASDIAIGLEEAQEALKRDSQKPQAATAAEQNRGGKGIPSWARVVGIVAVLAIVSASAYYVGLSRVAPGASSAQDEQTTTSLSRRPRPVKRYSISLSPDSPLYPGSGGGMALSPDGLLLVYVASTREKTRQLFLRRMDQLDAQPIAGTEGASSPFFSPDSQWIGFWTHDKLKKVSVLGDSPITLAGISTDAWGASWGDDGHIVFALESRTFVSEDRRGLKRISADGGPVEELMDESFMDSHGFVGLLEPVVLPGGGSVLFWSTADYALDDVHIAALNIESGELKFLVKQAFSPRYVSTGHLLYMQERTMMAAPFDAVTLEITGSAVPVTEGEMRFHPTLAIPTLFAVSTEGTLIYARDYEDPGEVFMDRTLVWVDREGNEELLAAPPRPYRYVTLSPDGGHLAVLISDQKDIWILDLTRELITLQRLTFDLQSASAPVWTPDGQRVAFSSRWDGRPSLLWMAANGTGSAESLGRSQSALWPYAWSRDGKFLIYVEQFPLSGFDICMLSLDDKDNRLLLAESYEETRPAISPDGRWMAYISDESGQFDVYVRPFPNVDDGKWLISAQGGDWPTWAPDGQELYYYSHHRGQMMAVSVEIEPTFAAGDPKVLFEGPYYVSSDRPYDVSPDGQRFLMIKEGTQVRKAGEVTEAPPITELIVVENWFEELKRLAPVGGKP